ncbi:hypothetical protein CHLRE_12g551352v5 [Chlamydomonas reinhardtii]|uniref:Amine oxidase domain-containing protein n=1 Tax=Chlamydomonas reinhardtii TaxID=3055 RepID=A0A2K3D647_CHLRE|nr:uncharacterized protein CHLRE_12g551352v5 [Chlamydomonas reinhardtii]PNW76009.1 hypothetical protein CHLRE_12g551352v5 [Chlamydomonas reinhardtii]
MAVLSGRRLVSRFQLQRTLTWFHPAPTLKPCVLWATKATDGVYTLSSLVGSARSRRGTVMEKSPFFAALALVMLAGATAVHATAMEKVGNYLIPVESGEIEGAETVMPKKCDVVVVGGGCGGIYSAYRLLSGTTLKPSVCTFEATNRVGGRIFSIRGLGKLADMTVDLGAYRYVDGRHTLVQGLVENLLKLKYVLYDPASTQFRKIVDDKGDDLGFVTFVEELTKLSMSLGMKLFLNSPVTKVDRMPSTSADAQYAVSVMGPNGKIMKVVAKHVIFNTPQRPLMRILQNSNLARVTEWSSRRRSEATHAGLPPWTCPSRSWPPRCTCTMRVACTCFDAWRSVWLSRPHR